MINYEDSPVGMHLTDLANLFGAIEIRHLGGARFIAIDKEGNELRMLADEGDGVVEGEDGFEETYDRHSFR
jgi:hypothetical protein